jgi:hypothetical protein
MKESDGENSEEEKCFHGRGEIDSGKGPIGRPLALARIVSGRMDDESNPAHIMGSGGPL